MYYDIMWRQEDVRKTSSFLGGANREKGFCGLLFPVCQAQMKRKVLYLYPIRVLKPNLMGY